MLARALIDGWEGCVQVMSVDERDAVRAEIARLVRLDADEHPIAVTPTLRALGAVLLSGAPGSVAVRFKARDDDVQGGGVIGGGVIANMLDSAIAIALLSVLKAGQGCATISLTVNMMAGARPGALVAKAAVDRCGSRVAFVSASLFDEYDRPVANATSSLAVLGAQA